MEEFSAVDFTSALPTSDLSLRLFAVNGFTIYCLFISVIKLHISKLFAVLSLSTDLLEFFWAIRHLINRHVLVIFHLLK